MQINSSEIGHTENGQPASEDPILPSLPTGLPNRHALSKTHVGKIPSTLKDPANNIGFHSFTIETKTALLLLNSKFDYAK